MAADPTQASPAQDTLRFLTCGSVDDGKSTLIGRLLWDTRQVAEDHAAALREESRRYGTQGDALDLALLVDGLVAEREQGITIDVAYRFFATARRKFIVADTPGHEQYTRNMVTGASTAQAAVLLVDARQGLLTQTRRHAFIAAELGLPHLILAVNKMDLAGFDAQVFGRIREAFEDFAKPLGFATVDAIPVCALAGDNIARRSERTRWYRGPTLLGLLETLPVGLVRNSARMVFPVQWVNRPHDGFRGYCGTVAEGRIAVGDRVRVTASGQIAEVRRLITARDLPESLSPGRPESVTMGAPGGESVTAAAGEAITLELDREIDLSRGDVLTLDDQPIESTDQFEALLVWFDEDHGLVGRSYELKLLHQWSAASITRIKYRIDPDSLAQLPAEMLRMNDLSVCNLALARPIAFDAFDRSRALGAFILVDRFTHATVAAGMIRHSLRRAQNVHRQALAIGREARERGNGHRGLVVWFTGLSGSGKSTLANALELALHHRGLRTFILDGDNIRQGLNKDLGFTEADRVENIRRIAEVARLMLDAGLIVITAFISPFRRERQMAREVVGPDRFLEVFVDTPLAVCEQRDVKGLYRKARAGLIPNMTGIGSPYEPPTEPDLVIDASRSSPEDLLPALLERVHVAVSPA
jgi:bifunctional enzyme CysN/CysC